MYKNLAEILKDYLRERFLKSNHPKYHKYMNDWINNLTNNQLLYFKEEKERRKFLNIKSF